MKIKGWAWSAALFAPLALNGGLRAEVIDLTSMLDEAAIQQVNCCESNCCEADCCDACDCGDSCCCFEPFWYAGAEFMFLGVDSDLGAKKGHGAVAAIAGAAGVAGGSASSYNDFTYAPRLTLGRQLSENWGVQTRFFYLSDDDSEGQPLPTALNSAAILTESGMRLYTIDVEAVRNIHGDVWKVDATGGVRHASLDMNSGVSVTGVSGAGDFATATAGSGSSFDGTGLTGALIGRRQLGSSRASLFTSARGSILFGDADAYAGAASSVLTGGGAAVNFEGALGEGSTEMTIIELAIGVQWDWALRAVPANAFFRTAFEYQNWDVNGDGAAFALGSATAPGAATLATASASAAEVDLYGLVIGAGFTW